MPISWLLFEPLPAVAQGSCGCCSVQGYGQKAPGIGAFVYPGSGATCDTRPVSAGQATDQNVAQPSGMSMTEEVCPCSTMKMIPYPHTFRVGNGCDQPGMMTSCPSRQVWSYIMASVSANNSPLVHLHRTDSFAVCTLTWSLQHIPDPKAECVH